MSIAVCLCSLPARRESLPEVLSALPREAHAYVAHPPAPARDPGPVWKWIAPRRLAREDTAVVIIDDDHAYEWQSLHAAVEQAMRMRAPALVSPCSRAWSWRENSIAHGGPYLIGRSVAELARSWLVEAAWGIAMRRAAFDLLVLSLRRRVPGRPQERWADDYAVCALAQRLGVPRYVVPRPRPRMLACARIDAVSERDPGIVRRYQALFGAETEAFRQDAYRESRGGGSP